MDYLNKALQSVQDLFELQNKYFTEQDVNILSSEKNICVDKLPTIDDVIHAYSLDSLYFNSSDEIKKIAGTLLVGVFKASVQSYYFLPIDSVQDQYGKTIEEAYPNNTSPEYMDLAKTFWTMRVLLIKLKAKHPSKVITQIFEWLEINIASVFFPSLDGKPIPPEMRRKAQKIILTRINYPGSIDAIIDGNHYTNPRGRKGCAAMLLCIFVAPIIAILALFLIL